MLGTHGIAPLQGPLPTHLGVDSGRWIQTAEVTKAANTEEIKGKEAKVKSEETALLNYKEDFATTGKELDAVLSYLDKLKPQCETKVCQEPEKVNAIIYPST